VDQMTRLHTEVLVGKEHELWLDSKAGVVWKSVRRGNPSG